MENECQGVAQTQAKAVADDLAKEGVTGMEDKEVVALIAYLQRLGTDIKWREAAPVTEAAPAAPAVSGAVSAVTGDPARGAGSRTQGAVQ
jgi:cytochrome c oxidase cbb3-type subunit I/II